MKSFLRAGHCARLRGRYKMNEASSREFSRGNKLLHGFTQMRLSIKRHKFRNKVLRKPGKFTGPFWLQYLRRRKSTEFKAQSVQYL